jgi:hypothetical protein
MSGLPVMLIVQGAVFLLWALLAVRILLHLRARARDHAGHTVPRPSEWIAATEEWLADTDETNVRRVLLLLSVILIGLSIWGRTR